MYDIKKIRKLLTFRYIVVLFLLLLLPSISFAKKVGPYSGQALDSRTGEPIQGASVFIYWEKGISFIAGHHSEPLKAVLVYTNEHGKYAIPRQFLNTGLTWVLEGTTIIIYQPGYQAWIGVHSYQPGNQRLFGKERTFSHTENKVKLERIPPGFDFKKHHEKITDALRGFDYYYNAGMDPMTGRPLLLRKIIKRTADTAAQWEFLRRIEWEK